MKGYLIEYREASLDAAPSARQLVRELAQLRQALADLREQSYVSDRDWNARRACERDIEKYQRTLDEMAQARPGTTLRQCSGGVHARISPSHRQAA